MHVGRVRVQTLSHVLDVTVRHAFWSSAHVLCLLLQKFYMAKDLMEMTSVLKGVPEALQPIFKEVKHDIQSKAMCFCICSSC